MYQYFLDSWTIIHQIGALLLRAGIARATSTRCSSWCRARLLVCGYVMIVYSFSGQFLLACSPAAVLSGQSAGDAVCLTRLHDARPALEPSRLKSTYGFWAHAGAVWVIGCVAAGRYTLAGFSAFVLLCLHPVMGAYMIALLIVTLVARSHFFRIAHARISKGAAFGACVTLISLVGLSEDARRFLGANRPGGL